MNTGTVKFFNTDKGFGFIKDDQTQEDIFVHISGLIDTIQEDDAVSYDVEQGQKGLNAVSVRQNG